MTFTILGSAAAAVGYAVAALLTKRALGAGAGVLRLSFVMNLLFLPVFATVLAGGIGAVDWSRLHWPVLAGVLFFAGQVLTFAAIRFGDVSLQTPLMGTKAVFVVLFSAYFGIGTVDSSIFIAGILAMTGVALLGVSGRIRFNHAGLTVVLALASSLAFAGSDTLVGAHGAAFSPRLFIVLMIAVNALLSFALTRFFREPLSAVPASAWPWIIAASLAMAGQALLLNYTLAARGEIAVANVIYSTRGLWSVLLAVPAAAVLKVAEQSPGRYAFPLRLGGALLMTAAVAAVFV